MSKSKLILSLMVFVALSLLSGCMSPIKTMPVSTYTLSDWRLSPIQSSGSHGTILVSAPIASPGYGTSKMVYVEIPYKLKAFANHRWVAPPANLLQPLIIKQLNQLGYFHAVVTPPYFGREQYQLITHLLMLEQEFLKPESSVHLVVQADLMDVGLGRIIASRVFDLQELAPENNPYGGVLATNKAAIKLGRQVSLFVLRSIKKQI